MTLTHVYDKITATVHHREGAYMNEKIQRLKRIIESSQRICVFTGAGISCPSGIPDFRSESGLYKTQNRFGYPPEQILSHTFFKNHTGLFFDFYRSSMVFPKAKPNKAHAYFAKLEANGKNVTVITQNIDSLHTKAGSKNVIELHGSVMRNYCESCKKAFSLEYILKTDGIPLCPCGGTVKPDVVLYEEPLDEKSIFGAVNAIERADALIVIGTSLSVYPAASYIRYFEGENLVLINKSETQYDSLASLCIYDDVVKVVEELEKNDK